jgi:imidazolonepropionase-like amidohydrolase
MTKTLYAGGLLFDGAARHTDHAVLVEDGRIVRVAPVGEFAGYDGERVDTSGGTVLPGLFDCHVHTLYGGEGNPSQTVQEMAPGAIVLRALENVQRTLAGGITAIRDCGGRNYLEFSVRDACNAGRFVGPTMHAAGRLICMTGGHGNKNGRVADGVDDVVKAVREQVHAGCDLVKIMATGGVMTPGVNPEDAHFSAEEMAAGIAEGHRFHKPCASHAQGTEGILNAVRGGVDSIEHGIFMNDHCVELMVEAGTFLVPTLAAIFNILRNADGGRIPAFVIEKSHRVADRHKQSVQMFYKAGGKIAMGTDAGTPFNYHGENARELQYMVDVGIAPTDALIAGTANAAALLRLEDRGHVADGNKADLLLVDGDPTADIAMAADKANHRLVLKDGRPVKARDSNAAPAPALGMAASAL